METNGNHYCSPCCRTNSQMPTPGITKINGRRLFNSLAGFKGIVCFEKYTDSLSCRALDEKMDTTLISYVKYEATASSQLAVNWAQRLETSCQSKPQHDVFTLWFLYRGNTVVIKKSFRGAGRSIFLPSDRARLAASLWYQGLGLRAKLS